MSGIRVMRTMRTMGVMGTWTWTWIVHRFRKLPILILIPEYLYLYHPITTSVPARSDVSGWRELLLGQLDRIPHLRRSRNPPPKETGRGWVSL
jgi:hypothetical protein